jgi:hypothetical protein
MVTGFAYRNGEWWERSFKPDDKFIVRPAREFNQDSVVSIVLGIPKAKWGVVRLGEEEATASCEHDFDAGDRLYCGGGFDVFRMNRKTLRFLHAYLLGYWDGTPGAETGTPAVAIGKCSLM